MSGLGLLTPLEVAARLRVRDRRTVRKRLAALAVPVVPFGNSYRVREVDLERAIAAVAVVQSPRGAGTRPAGVILKSGERLWDGVAHQGSPGVPSRLRNSFDRGRPT